MKIIPIVIAALGAVPKVLESRLDELEIRGETETIQSIIEIGQNI